MSFEPSAPQTIGQFAIWAVVTIGIIAVVYVMAQAVGISIPPFIMTLFWICLAVMIVVFAIRFISRQAG